VGIQIAKYTVLEVDLYKMIYSVRYSPSVYVERLKRLEAGIRQWKEELPWELRDPSHASQDDQIFTLYLEYWYQAYHLILHHPAVCRSTDPAIVDSNLDKCLDASQKMLQNCNTLMLKKSLDIPWINTVVYIAAMFTTLFISSARKEQLSPVDMEKLRSDMTTWVSVLGECDHFLGKLKQSTAMFDSEAVLIPYRLWRQPEKCDRKDRRAIAEKHQRRDRQADCYRITCACRNAYTSAST
jgi:hypothetical protein